MPEPPKKQEKKPLKWSTANKNRPKQSAFRKQASQASNSETFTTPAPSAGNGTKPSSVQPDMSDAEKIHLQSIRKLQSMSEEEITKEREQLFKTLDPAVLQSLLRRAEIKEAEMKGSADFDNPPVREVTGVKAPPHGSTVEWFPDGVTPNPETANEGVERTEQIKDSELSEKTLKKESGKSVHFDSDEVEEAHTHFPPPPEELKKYFPDLPVETDKLAWMQPISSVEEDEYSAEMTSVKPSELRFDFKGNLLTPRQSQLVPTSAGLHHHGDAPAAAGYTLPELGRLARSSHPAQRSIAIQTSGRILHKLFRKQFAKSSDLQEGLEALVRETRILDTLIESSSDRNLTVRTLAIEALWLANPDKRETEDVSEKRSQDKLN